MDRIVFNGGPRCVLWLLGVYEDLLGKMHESFFRQNIAFLCIHICRRILLSDFLNDSP